MVHEEYEERMVRAVVGIDVFAATSVAPPRPRKKGQSGESVASASVAVEGTWSPLHLPEAVQPRSSSAPEVWKRWW